MMGGEGTPEVSRLMELDRRAYEPQPTEWVICSTCRGLVCRKTRRRFVRLNPPDFYFGEAGEMLADANETRKQLQLPLLDVVPVAALEVLAMRRRRMMKDKRCPTCYRPVSDSPRPVSDSPETDEAFKDDDRETDQSFKDDAETMVADAGKKGNKRSKKSKRSTKKKKKKKKRTNNRNKRSMEETLASEGKATAASKEGLTGNNPRTKTVTTRLSKRFVQQFIEMFDPFRPFAPNVTTNDHIMQSFFAREIAEHDAESQVYAYWQSQCDIKGYVEFQEEITDDEDA